MKKLLKKYDIKGERKKLFRIMYVNCRQLIEESMQIPEADIEPIADVLKLNEEQTWFAKPNGVRIERGEQRRASKYDGRNFDEDE